MLQNLVKTATEIRAPAAINVIFILISPLTTSSPVKNDYTTNPKSKTDLDKTTLCFSLASK